MSYNQKYDRLKPLVDVVDKVRRILSEEPIQLPAIAVIGDQCSGKSSVLESLSEIELPRGTGIVTRCALELRMRSVEPNESERATIRAQRYNRNADDREEEIKDFGVIPHKIEEYTAQLAGDKKGICFDGCIELTVYKHGLPNLTLIDLPGITRVALQGQDENIEAQITDLYKKYITREETVILNVLPATQDFTNNATIKLSREADPKGERTVAVVTKLDKIDNEKHMLEMLESLDELNLKLGFCVVRNRTQAEVESKTSRQQARAAEYAFFQKHSSVEKQYNGRLGVDALAHCLVGIQSTRIKDTLPKTRQKIAARLDDLKDQFEQIPPPVASDSEANALFVKLMRAFGDSIGSLMKGEKHLNGITGFEQELKLEERFVMDETRKQLPFDTEHKVLSQVKLPALHNHAAKIFARQLSDLSSSFLSEAYRQQMLQAVLHNAGTSLPNHHPPAIVVEKIQDELKKIQQPARELIDFIEFVMQKVCEDLCRCHIQGRDALEEWCRDALLKHLTTCKRDLLKWLDALLDREQYLFTVNHYYQVNVDRIRDKIVKQQKAYAQAKQEQENDEARRRANPSGYAHIARPPAPILLNKMSSTYQLKPLDQLSNEEKSCLELQVSIKAYWKVLGKRIVDEIASQVRYVLMFCFARDAVPLITQSTLDGEVLELLKDPYDIITRRENLARSIRNLEAAEAELKKAWLSSSRSSGNSSFASSSTLL